MDKRILGLLALVLLVGAGCNTATPNNNLDLNPDSTIDVSDDEMMDDDSDETRLNDDENPDANPDNDDTDGDDTGAMGNVKEFTVTGSPFKFEPANMTVNKGDTVKITFKNEEGFHDLVIDEFDARTKQIAAGQEETIEFVADQAGSFEYYCSVGNHRAMGMKGTLTVNE